MTNIIIFFTGCIIGIILTSILTNNNTELGSTYAKSKSFMNSVNNAIDKLDIDDEDISITLTLTDGGAAE